MRFRLAGLFLSASMAVFAADQWIKLVSPNFEMYTSNGERTARDALLYFEQVHGFFAKVMNLAVKPEAKVRIIAFRSEKEFKPYSVNAVAAAFYLHGLDTDYIVLERANADLYPAVVHEYVHYLVGQTGVENMPLWLNEGLAELYATLRPVDHKVKVGVYNPGHLRTLSQGKWLDLEALLAANTSSSFYNEKNRAGMFYSQAWLLTHMLSLADGYRGKFLEFLNAILTTNPPSRAFEVVYGKSTEDVTRDLRDYSRAGHMKLFAFDVTLDKRAESPSIEEAPDFEVSLNLAQLLLSTPARKEAVARLRELTKTYPDRAETYEVLGHIESSEGNYAAAAADFAKAAAHGAGRSKMYLSYWNVAYRSGAGEKELRPIMAHLAEFQPGNLAERLQIAWMYYQSHDYASSLRHLKQVRQVDRPNAFRYFELLAYAGLQAGDTVEAKAASGRAANYAQTQEERNRMEELRRYLDRPQANAASIRPPTAPGNSEERPTLRRGEAPQPVTPGESASLSVVEGALSQVDCIDKRARLHISVEGRDVILAILDPGTIAIRSNSAASVEFTCGRQKDQRIKVEFEAKPDAELATSGVVRSLEFR
ncbi:MAG: hypothetical protein IT165_13490 [Bryobacterales bacterium]|nr:hypothetical protein [Bryobacterales bacterium]